MKKKLLNKSGATLITALLLLIIISTFCIVTTLLVGQNSKVGLDRVNKRLDIIKTENATYEILNKIVKDSSLLSFSKEEDEVGEKVLLFDENFNVVNANNLYQVKILRDGSSYNFIVNYKKINLNVNLTFDFVNSSYKILKWGR